VGDSRLSALDVFLGHYDFFRHKNNLLPKLARGLAPRSHFSLASLAGPA